MKDAFVSNVSHELRTPITGIKLNYGLLSLNPERKDVYLARMGREIDRLNNLIEDLLRLSRLDQDRVELSLQTVDLNDLGSQLVQDRAPIAEDRSLSLTFEEAPYTLDVLADPGLLGQAISVLITNAINYTPAGGRVTVSTVIKDKQGLDWVGLCVSDTGPGIPPEELPRLFERFFRGAVGRASGAAGTGLGLAIAKEIVSRHNGHIEVQGKPEAGQGASFTIWLPQEDTGNE